MYRDVMPRVRTNIGIDDDAARRVRDLGQERGLRRLLAHGRPVMGIVVDEGSLRA